MITEKINDVELGFVKRKYRFLFVSMCLALIALILAGMILYLGNTKYPLSIILRVLAGEEIKGATFAIMTLRLPRMLAGLLAGMAFGMAGCTFQTMLRNPLASPDIIGITSGSSVAAVFCILVFQVSGSAVSIAAVISGLLVSSLIYILSRGGSFSGGRLILIGIGLQAMLNAVISYLLLRANHYDVPAALRWLNGSLNGIQMKSIPALCFTVLFFGGLLVLLGRKLKILELGEHSAITLGLRTDRTRILLVLCAVFLIAVATAVTGPISFVAFLAGPIAGWLAGKGIATILPAGLTGSVLVLLADIIGQYAFDTNFPVGIITGILGAPYLLYLLIRMNKTGGAA
ncbi:FecCD family ABC transporter permease [Candidatus Galacturonibacter soehngenii]|uniref:Iron chelate uptake ABC transporter family permease subunit n=1 Tax=Candidatus Galacturonatibacter soehngenii TaxID=2307010 RepID=A0A7V7QL82_9FIRM|nr:iron chelate uptake ABC transporter family permease subunit [Candidatus Galacturonibacter soehngenii]KAB1438418.1 iron chelate uptake ABC transporter family permease subunit [Candidatus Galacturonibacter soehngenii]